MITLTRLQLISEASESCEIPEIRRSKKFVKIEFKRQSTRNSAGQAGKMKTALLLLVCTTGCLAVPKPQPAPVNVVPGPPQKAVPGTPGKAAPPAPEKAAPPAPQKAAQPAQQNAAASATQKDRGSYHLAEPQGVATGYNCPSYPCLIFEDEFNTLNLSLWQHEITAGGGGNWEFQYYTNNRSNSYVREGTLYIKPTLTTGTFGNDFLSTGKLELWGHQPGNKCTGQQWYGCERQGTSTNYINPIQSARLRTADSFSFTYGRVEVEAKMPSGDWIWPAIWMLPRYNQYGDWPASGEIDLMEGRGNRNLRNQQGDSVGCDHGGPTMHWGPFGSWNSYQKTQALTNSDFCDSFHRYRMDWDENSITFYINDVEMLKVDPGAGGFWEYGEFDKRGAVDNPWIGENKMAPFNRPFYLILNVAVGGTNHYFNDPPGMVNSPYPKPWSNTSPQAPREFWSAVDSWYPTWNPTVNNGENAALQVKSVKVWKLQA